MTHPPPTPPTPSPSTALPDLLLPLLLLLPVAWALLQSGLPNTADMPVHFFRAAEMVHAWRDGVLLPRWSENLGFGYGIPLFSYAPPLPYLLTALLHTLGLPLEAALKGTLLVALLLAAFGAYRLARDPLGPLPGAVSAAAFLYAPFRLRELFIQGNVAQFLAWSFLPWAIWGLLRLAQGGQPRYRLIVALALAGALLSHNVVALVLAALLGWLALLLALADRATFPRSLLALLLGLALAAWFWLPALAEGEFIQLSRIVASDFRARFVPWRDLIALSPPLDRSAINPFFPLTLGAAQVALALVGLLCLLRRGQRGGVAGAFFASLALGGAFMALRPSQLLWERLPFLDLFEFPARWHGFTALALGWLAALALHTLGQRSARLEARGALLALLLLIGSALVNLYPHHLPPGILRASPADVVRFEVESGAVGTTSLGEFTPATVTEPLTDSPLVADYLAGRPPARLDPTALPAGSRVIPLSSSAQAHSFRLELAAPTPATLRLHAFPGWRATLDGQPITLGAEPGSGLLTVALPAGSHDLALTFGETPLRLGADLLSGAGWLWLAVGAMRALARRLRHPRPTLTVPDTTALRPLLPVASALALVLLAYFLLPQRFTLASPPDSALPAAQPLRADWGDEIRLLGIEPPPTVVQAGESLTLVSYWRSLRPLQEEYALFLHLDDPTGRTVATVDQRHPAEIPTAAWPPSLYLRAPLTLSLPPDLAPIRYSLRVGFYDPQGEQRLALAGGEATDLEVAQVWVESAAPPRPAGPTARFGDTIHLRGLTVDRDAGSATLFWQASAPIPQEVTIFLHLYNAQGTLLGQADGLPFDNRYPTSAWRVGQLIPDVRPLPLSGGDLSRLDHLAIGLYDPATGQRLPATDATGQPLPDNRLVVPFAEFRP